MTIPRSVTSIEHNAFTECQGLTLVEFTGNAPSMGKDVFVNTAADFSIRYQNDAKGFASPTWTTSSGDQYPASPAAKDATLPPEDGRGMDEDEATKKVSSVNGPPFENSLGMLFLPVPITGGPTAGGKVMFSVWDTRLRDYEVFARETKRKMEDAGFPQGADHPVVKVSWDEAQAFCAWLTARERDSGELPKTHAYRLPSDHEWSCAAGIGDLQDASVSPEEKPLKIANPHAKSDDGGGFRCVLAPVIATVVAGESNAT